MSNDVAVTSVIEADLDTVHVVIGCAANVPGVLLPALHKFGLRQDVVVDESLRVPDIADVWSRILEQLSDRETSRVDFIDDFA